MTNRFDDVDMFNAYCNELRQRIEPEYRRCLYPAFINHKDLFQFELYRDRKPGAQMIMKVSHKVGNDNYAVPLAEIHDEAKRKSMELILRNIEREELQANMNGFPHPETEIVPMIIGEEQ